MFKKRPIFIACNLAIALASATALAQIEGSEDISEMELIEVTGSKIKRQDLDSSIPVTILTAEDLEVKGISDVQTALASLSQNSGGVIDQSNNNDFIKGSSTINLRGVGANRTLILIDGKRMPVFPIAAGTTTNFVDTSSIPFAAIERIEVLTDGGSAIYGSDAMGGVVNIILKKNLKTSGIQLRHEGDGDYSSDNVQFFTGAGFAADRGSVSLVGEYRHNDQMTYDDRDYLRERPGVDIALFSAMATFGDFGAWSPVSEAECQALNGEQVDFAWSGQSQCGTDIGDVSYLMPEMSSLSLMSNFSYEISDNMQLVGRANYRKGDMEGSRAAPYYRGGDYGGLIPYGSESVPDGWFDGWMAPWSANNPSGAWGRWARSITERPGYSKADDESWGLMLGLEGSLGGYDWSVSIGHNRVETDTHGAAVIGSRIDLAVENGLDLSQPITDQALLDEMVGEWQMAGYSKNTTFDVTLSGSLFAMPAGLAMFAVTADAQRTAVDARQNDILALGESGFAGVGAVGERDQWGVGAEVEMPLHETLSLQMAARIDGYSDASATGTKPTAMARLSYTPADWITLRTSYNETFRAPDMQRVYDGGSSYWDWDPNYGWAFATFGPGTGLEEETGTTKNFGIVLQPVEDLSLTVDAYNIRIEGEVLELDWRYMLAQQQAGNTQYDQYINFDYYYYVAPPVVNNAYREISGIDFAWNYSFAIGAYGQISTGVNWTHLTKHEFEQLGGTVVDLLENPNVYGSSAKDKGSMSVSWSKDNYAVNMFVNRVGSIPQVYNTTESVDAFTKVNLSASYFADEHWNVTLGANNLLDEEPPVDPTLTSGYNQSYHDAFGRMLYISAAYEL